MAGPDDKFTGDPVDASSPGLPSYGPGEKFVPPVDKIDAIPGILINNNIAPDGKLELNKLTLSDPTLFEPTAGIKSAMAEGQAFGKQDAAAMKWLTKFLTESDTGFRVYHATARSEGHNYINADQVGASFFENIDKKKAPESYFSKDVTSGIYS